MIDCETIVNTEASESDKRVVHLTIKYRIGKFGQLMKSYEPGERLCSGDVASKLAPQAVWKMRCYPNGRREKRRGDISVYLDLTGPMEDNSETLDATHNTCLVDGLGRKITVGVQEAFNYGVQGYSRGWCISHEQVRRALQVDGSLLMVADIEFLVPYDNGGSSGVSRKVCEANALRGDDVTQKQPGFVKFLFNHSRAEIAKRLTEKQPVSVKSEIDSDRASSEHDGSEIEKRSIEAFFEACALHGDEAQKQPGSVKSPSELHSDRASSDHDGSEIEKVLNKENVIAMAEHADTHSHEMLKEACIELIARTGKTVFESAVWTELKESKPRLAADLAEGVATAVLVAKKP